MSNYPAIDILLATYNGEKYLPEQIQSILDQTYVHWRLLVRDDGSTDGTPDVIRAFAQKYPNKIVLLADDQRRRGACGNFGVLLGHATSDYVMFCDQDDVWLPHKIETTFQKMKAMEKAYGRTLPLLVYTDMKVVDDGLNNITYSYWKHQSFCPKNGARLSRQLVSNVIVGCTVMMNRKLLELSLPMPEDALMHDWWFGLVAACFGRCQYLSEPTVLYRQHAHNAVGATWGTNLKNITRNVMRLRNHRNFLIQSQRQATSFLERYGHMLTAGKRETVCVYANLNSLNWVKRRYYVVKHGFWWSGALRSFALLLIV